jgi:hypothetical protein
MKKLLSLTCAFMIAWTSFAQCTEEAAAKLPFTSEQKKAFKYIGTNGKENIDNTESMYKKMVEINKLFKEVFNKNTGMVYKWKAQVDNINNEGLVKGHMEIYLQKITCNKTEFNTTKGGIPLEFEIFINGFEPWIFKYEKKAFGFTELNRKDSLNGHLLYLIAEKQMEETFKGFPLYYSGWNNRPDQSVVVITKPNTSLFKPITIGEFVGLFRNWTANYHPNKPGSSFEVTPAKIDKFVNSNNKQFFQKPCITLYDRVNQIQYIRKNTFVDDPTQGNPWVIFNTDYIEKDAAATSLQFISIEWHKGDDEFSQKFFNDFKNNFDFKKLQAMLGK